MIEGFRSIASLRVELRPINIIIGANGSGKSNFLGAFEFFREISAGRLKVYVGSSGGAEKILHFGAKATEQIRLRVSFNPRNNPIATSSYEVTLIPAADDSLFEADETLIPDGESLRLGPYPKSLDEWRQPAESAVSNPQSNMFTKGLRHTLDFWQPFHLHDTSFLRKTARVDDDRYLNPDGANLAAVLHYLRDASEDIYRFIVDTIRQAAPFFGDFDLVPRNRDRNEIILEWRHRESDQLFGASALSDGTLRFIALTTLLLDPRRNRRSLILIDEPELGLHPSAIALLASLIRQAARDTQIIVSTQSPLLLDHFDPEDVLVADRTNGGTVLNRLVGAQLQDWLKDYSLGQLWEKNELGGRPVAV